MTIEELCKRSYDIAVSKGWHEQKRSLGEAIALMHSEVSEAVECFRDPLHQPGDTWYSEGGKPEGMVYELADLLIRIADTSVDLKIPVSEKMVNSKVSDFGVGFGGVPESLLELLSGIHKSLSLAYRSSMLWYVPEGEEIANFFADAMENTGYLCRSNDWNLEKAVEEKMRYNETRARRHGGKRA